MSYWEDEEEERDREWRRRAEEERHEAALEAQDAWHEAAYNLEYRTVELKRAQEWIEASKRYTVSFGLSKAQEAKRRRDEEAILEWAQDLYDYLVREEDNARTKAHQLGSPRPPIYGLVTVGY